jgi:hypothetical protein
MDEHPSFSKLNGTSFAKTHNNAGLAHYTATASEPQSKPGYNTPPGQDANGTSD